MELRLVQYGDAKEILDIYTPYIKETTITFEYDIPSLPEFTKRIEEISNTMPYLVAIEDNKIIGYAYASKYRSRAAYQWAIELSIYVDKNNTSKHIGSRLYTLLLATLKELGYHTAYACIALPNHNSINFHQKFGFKEVGTLHQCGYKFNTWLNTMWMEYYIQESNSDLQPPKAIYEIDIEEIKRGI